MFRHCLPLKDEGERFISVLLQMVSAEFLTLPFYHWLQMMDPTPKMWDTGIAKRAQVISLFFFQKLEPPKQQR